ncbi:nucleotide kinase domain-containing protein [Pseudomonas alliivorans]|nr:nucleotide kinase domain-containing protein [Pseudomonas alliivorans]MEE5146889.1 nucleotide kinase domain-containing protein [Pseudomonas alliivorans]
MLKTLEKSSCYDEYWRFAHLRQERFYARLNGTTSEPNEILDTFKFTNCYRILDRTSQYLIKNIMPSETYDPASTFFRAVLFKVFNKIETWQHLESKLGSISIESYDEKLYSDILKNLKNCEKIYSAAYIMPSGKNEYGSHIKHENNLRMITYMLKIGLHEKVWEAKTLKGIYDLFLGIPSIGRFLAFQYSIDICYSEHSLAEENQFVAAGPGALRGISKCFPNAAASQAESIIKYMTDNQDSEFERLGIPFKYLTNRKLQLIDCQNLFCEIDKYLRVARPDLNQKKSRIKQHYKKNDKEISFVLPKKWKASIPRSI